MEIALQSEESLFQRRVHCVQQVFGYRAGQPILIEPFSIQRLTLLCSKGSGSGRVLQHSNHPVYGKPSNALGDSHVGRIEAMGPKEILTCLIARDLESLEQLGLEGLVKAKRPRGDFASLDKVHHPARHLLKDLKYRRAPVRFSTEPWSEDQARK